jgi:hypothetical protein
VKINFCFLACFSGLASMSAYAKVADVTYSEADYGVCYSNIKEVTEWDETSTANAAHRLCDVRSDRRNSEFAFESLRTELLRTRGDDRRFNWNDAVVAARKSISACVEFRNSISNPHNIALFLQPEEYQKFCTESFLGNLAFAIGATAPAARNAKVHTACTTARVQITVREIEGNLDYTAFDVALPNSQPSLALSSGAVASTGADGVQTFRFTNGSYSYVISQEDPSTHMAKLKVMNGSTVLSEDLCSPIVALRAGGESL